MGVNNNTELQSMLNQALSQMNSLGLSSSSIGSSSGSGNNYINSLWTIAGQAQGAIEGNDEQKAQAALNIFQGLLNMISFSKNHQTEAQKEVNQNSQNITKTENQENKKAQEIEAKIEQVIGSISTNQTNLQNAIDELQGLQNYNEDIEEIKANIEAQIAVIEENKQKLNDPEQREEALAAINGAAGAINMYVELLGSTIADLQEGIETQQAIVEENVNQITTTITDATQQITEGVADLQSYIQAEASNGAAATKITAKAPIDMTTGTTEVATGEAINSNLFSSLASGGQGIKLITDGQGRISAGQTRIQGGVSNLQKVMSGIGKMGQDISALSELTKGIGEVGNGVIGLVGCFEEGIAPYIQSVGTYDIEAICTANNELQAQVKAWNAGEVSENNTQASAEEQQKADPINNLKKAFGI